MLWYIILNYYKICALSHIHKLTYLQINLCRSSANGFIYLFIFPLGVAMNCYKMVHIPNFILLRHKIQNINFLHKVPISIY